MPATATPRWFSSEAMQWLQQAARELLLAQSSDWSFILRAGTTTELAKERVQRHLGRFWQLMRANDGSAELPEGWLEEVQADDRLFTLIQPLDWAPLQPPVQPSTPSG